ncbi:UNVERIFIED_CONTAM: hypothetical protein BEN50_20195 [Euhalothece sp. KZN 001]
MVNYSPQVTSDGSYTFFSSEFQETFHSLRGGKQEAREKFILPCELITKAKKQSHLSILDVCYGLGYNTAEALESIWTVNPNCVVTLIAIESDLTVPQSAIEQRLLNLWSPSIEELLTTLAQEKTLNSDRFQGKLLIGDGRQTILEVIEQNFLADAIFLDPFSPPHCPQLWTVEFLEKVSQCLHKEGRLATYSCAAAMRTAFSLAGLYYSSTMGMNRRSTVASWKQEHLSPLTQLDREHQQTRAAIPYRDPNLNHSPEMILAQRHQEQLHSNLESTSQWRKRWRKKIVQEELM